MAWFDRPVPLAGPAVTPLTRQRLQTLVEGQDWKYSLDDDGDIRARFNGDLFSFILSGAQLEILNVLGYMPEDIPMSLLEEARTVIEDWRREHLWPGLFWRENDDAGLTFSVGGAVAVDWEDGVTDAQLLQHLQCGIATCNDAFAEVRDHLGLARIESEIADAKASQYDLRSMTPQERRDLVGRLIAQDDEEVVIRLLTSLDAEDPGLDDDLRGTLAAAYGNTGRYEEALEQLERLRPPCRDSSRWHYRRGAVLHRLSTRADDPREASLRAEAREEYRTSLRIDPTSDVAADCAQLLGLLGEDASDLVFTTAVIPEIRRALGTYTFGDGVLSTQVDLWGRPVPVEVVYSPGPVGEAELLASLSTLRAVADQADLWRARLGSDEDLGGQMRAHLPDPADLAELRGRIVDAVVRLVVNGELLTLKISDVPTRFRADVSATVEAGITEVTRT